MSNEVVKFDSGGKTIVLVGTAHISRASVETVGRVIDEENPDVVCVELCKDRKHALLEEKKWDATDIEKVMREGKIYLFLVQVLLSNFQRRIGEELGVKPGSEMLEAIRKAGEKNIPVELVDRDVRVTLKRAIQKTKISEKARILMGFFNDFFSSEEIDEQLVEELKGEDMISKLLEELAKEAPSVKEVLVDERNQYIADRISSLKAGKVVAVVGAGHLKGIRELLEQDKSEEARNAEIGELEKVYESKSRFKLVGYAIPILFLGLVSWGFVSHGSEVTIRMLSRWILVNGSLSALGALLAAGHPLSIITAFFAAPITSLNPALAAGWFAGFVELKMRKPRVADFKCLFKLKGLRDYWGNRVTRVLLVVALANLGSSLGTFIALPYIASLI